LGLPVKWLGMALFSSPHLLLRCKGPSLRPAGKEGSGFHWGVALQAATRAAVQVGVDLIRKMRFFEDPHAFASYRNLVE